MTPRFDAAGKVAVVGFAHSPIVRASDMALGPLTLRTILEAVDDAGLVAEQIDGFTTGALFPSSGGRTVVDGIHTVTADWVADHLRVEPRWLCGFQGIGQICGSVILAVDAIASGAADYVVVHRSLYNPVGRYHANPMTHAAGVDQWTAPHGYWGPVVQMAMPYTEYLQRYGASRDDLGRLVVGARAAGAKVPWSHWRDRPITLDDYLDGRMIAEPMSVLDCDIPVTGVGAFVLTSADRAKDLPHKPVYVAGYAQGRRMPTNGVPSWRLDDLIGGGQVMARQLWENVGFGPDDVDVPQIYDGFTPFLWLWLEALGYCGPGEAPAYALDESTSAGFPFRTGGGAVGNGRMHGVPQMAEAYLQLAGRAGPRQLPRAESAIACQSAPSMGGVIAYTTEPL